MSDDRKVVRTGGEPSYGVTLHYNKEHTKVSAQSHFPYVWVNTDQLHIDKATYLDASPLENEFMEYFGAMQCTIDKIDETIARLTEDKARLASHLEKSMMQMSVCDDAV